MCKLCNNNDIFIEHPYNITTQVSSITNEFKKVVIQYTKEYPCNKVIKYYKAYTRISNKLSIDEWILKRLLKVYRPSIITDAAFAVKKGRLVGTTKECKAKYEAVESNIQKLVYSTGTVRFQVNYYIRKVGNKTKKFKTLKEAQQYKQEVLNNEYKTA